ncbi:MAG: glycosyltransferase [Rhodobacter sp.]|nr:glycosyltransferase [Rhodobacter sp.]
MQDNPDGASDGFRVFAILPNAPEWTYLSLSRDCGSIDVLVPEWLTVTGADYDLTRESQNREARQAIAAFRRRAPNSVSVMPAVGIGSDVQPAAFVERLQQEEFRARFIDDIRTAVEAAEAQGTCIDLTGWRGAKAPALAIFFGDLREVFGNAGLETCLISPANLPYWKSRSLIDAVDYVVLNSFQEPWVGSPAAPLAPFGWFENLLDEALRLIAPDKLVISIGSYTADWVSGHPLPKTISYAEAMARIAKAGGRVELDAVSQNSFSSFVDDSGQRHSIWFLDAVTAQNQVVSLRGKDVSNIAISDLGFEDPGVWRVLDPNLSTPRALAQALRDVHVEDYVSYEGEGPFLRVNRAAQPGKRRIEFDAETRRIKGQSYFQLPMPVSIERYGRAAANQIVLTFDDGPHPEYTRKILDTLAAEGVPAAFFLVGNNALRTPDLVRRMIDEGHEIGSHTFMHPRMDQISYYRTVVEVNSVQKLINGMTDRAMLLYREPYMRNAGPLTARRAESLQTLASAGYILAGSDIVPPDWEDTTADGIVSHVLEKVSTGAGNVIVLHDAGGNRAQTVAAVPILINALRDQGYEFVSMGTLLGMPRDSLMPPLAGSHTVLDDISFGVMALLWEGFVWVFWAAILIGVGRSVAVLVLAIIRRRPQIGPTGYLPSVTVVIPAFNEEVVIAKCIDKVLASKYRNLNVIVVDDGSHDGTYKTVRARFGHEPRVRLLKQPNGGKWRALNAAYAIIDTEIAICIDADTQIDSMAVATLVRHFQNPRVGAVAGRLRIGNKRNILTLLQALEYTTAQNIDRRAADLINGMLVVPGAIGAWRVSAVREAGLYSGETLSEDADLTVSVTRAGYRVTYDERAIAYTEAPTRLRSFLRQRLRWSLGMLQTGWKHKRAAREGRPVGLVSLPDLAVFGYLFPVMAPLADIFFFYMLYDLAGRYWSDDLRVSPELPTYLFWGYLALPLMDIVTAFVALCLDRKEKFSLLLLFPIQRLFYRQLLYYSVFRALLRALTGRLAAWSKADRVGFATLSRGSTQ